MAARMANVGGSNFGHPASLAAQGPDHKFARRAPRRTVQTAAKVLRLPPRWPNERPA
jgi:hypothetical protein